MTIDNMIAEGDEVAAYISWTGTHKGQFLGIAPTGKEIKDSAGYFYKFKDGKQTESKGIGNVLSIYQQMGVAPPMG